MTNSTSNLQQQDDQSQTADGETTEPPHEANSNHIDLSASISSTTTVMSKTNGHHSIPLPPPEAGAYVNEKEPGHTIGSLKELVMAANGDSPSTNNAHIKQPSMASSSQSSPGTSSEEDQHSDWASEASTRPPTQPSSRAPSMSAGKSGDKLIIPKTAISQSSPGTPISQSKTPAPKVVQKSISTPSTPQPPQQPTQPTKAASKAASVHSTEGKDDKHKFTLKDLLASAPKLSRKSSQRSTSSRKSDTDRDSIHDGYRGPYGSGPKSAAGDSTTSLSKKYGVCQKLAIGKGATSVVRLAHKWDRTEEKLYAVKEFRKRRKNESEKEYVKKLTSEFCISSTLHHVNIVETVDLVQDENQKWCEVMEFCPGGDLYAAIKKGGMSPSEVECCFKQILSGVRYLHSQGVAHRDIKPENLFFDTKGHLKIGDYGASTVYRLPWEATVHMSTGLCGSEPYIAPEQFLGKPYDARLVDIWACGIVYYCLHFQELPWRVAQQSDTLYQAYAAACASSTPAVSSCPPTINNLSPRACRSLIRKMLEPDPKARATIDDVWKHSWMDTIEVCHEAESPKHVHVHAQALAQAQLSGARD